MLEFLGRIMGKALYEGILLEYSFSPLFISKLLGRYSFLDELSSLDAELHRNLVYLKVSLCLCVNSGSYIHFHQDAHLLLVRFFWPCCEHILLL